MYITIAAGSSVEIPDLECMQQRNTSRDDTSRKNINANSLTPKARFSFQTVFGLPPGVVLPSRNLAFEALLHFSQQLRPHRAGGDLNGLLAVVQDNASLRA
jgi:hypothetical protein